MLLWVTDQFALKLKPIVVGHSMVIKYAGNSAESRLLYQENITYFVMSFLLLSSFFTHTHTQAEIHTLTFINTLLFKCFFTLHIQYCGGGGVALLIFFLVILGDLNASRCNDQR